MNELLELLKEELENRQKKNSLYSMRSFAKQLNIHPATLSHILNGNRKISTEFRQKVYKFLELTQEKINLLEAKEEEVRRNFILLEKSYLDTISDWHYDAILELMRTKNFVHSTEFISERLGITPKVTEEAIEKLIEIGRLELNEKNEWVDLVGDSLIYDDVDASVALISLQKSIANKALLAFDEIPREDREQASMCMAISKEDLPWVRAKIKKFQQELCEHLQKKEENSDEVYQLMTSFFPLTKN